MPGQAGHNIITTEVVNEHCAFQIVAPEVLFWHV